MVDFFLIKEKIRNVGRGEYGLGKYIVHEDSNSARLRAGLLKRLYQEFRILDEQQDDFELVFETLESEMFRKEVAAAARRQDAERKAQAQVLGSSPSLVQRLFSMHESPLKQVQSNHPETSEQGYRRTMQSFTFAQVRLCSPNRLRGERLSPVQRLCRMYTREAPAEADRPRRRLRSQVRSAAASDGPSADAASRNIRAGASTPIDGRNAAPQPAASPVPTMSSQRAVPPSASPMPTQPAAARTKPPVSYAEPPSGRPASDGQRSQPPSTSKLPTLAARGGVEQPAALPVVTAAASTANAKVPVTDVTRSARGSAAPPSPSRSAQHVSQAQPVVSGLSRSPAPAAVPTRKQTVGYAEPLRTPALHMPVPSPHVPAVMQDARRPAAAAQPRTPLPQTTASGHASAGSDEDEDEDDGRSPSDASVSPQHGAGLQQQCPFESPSYGEADVRLPTHTEASTGRGPYTFDESPTFAPASSAPAALSRYFFPTPVDAFLFFALSGPYPPLLELLFRQPEHVFKAADGSLCLVAGPEAVVQAAMQHGCDELERMLSVEHVFCSELQAVSALDITQFLMRSPFQVLSRHVLAHLVARKLHLLVHVTFGDGRRPCAFDGRCPCVGRTEVPDLVFSSERNARDPHRRPLYHLGPPASAPFYSAAADEGEGDDAPDADGQTLREERANDAPADGAGAGAAEAVEADPRPQAAAPAAAPTRYKAPDNFWTDRPLSVGPAPRIAEVQCFSIWVQQCLGAAVFYVLQCLGAAVFGCSSVSGCLGSQLALWGLVLMNPDYDKTSAASYEEPEIARSPQIVKVLEQQEGDVFEALPLLAKMLLLVFRGGVTWGEAQLEVKIDGTPVFWEHTHVSTGRSWGPADMAKSALRAIRNGLDTRDRKAASASTYAEAEQHLSAVVNWLRYIFDDGKHEAAAVLNISTMPLASARKTVHASSLGVTYQEPVGNRAPSRRSVEMQELAGAHEAAAAEDQRATTGKKRKNELKATGGARAGTGPPTARIRR